MVSLAVAVIAAVLDATRSIAGEAVVLASVAQSWTSVSPAGFAAFEAAIAEAAPAFVWSAIVAPLLSVPAFAFFGGLALLLYVAGRRPHRRPGRYVLEH